MKAFARFNSRVLQDIGQLTPDEIKELNKLVKQGKVVKSREYWHGWGDPTGCSGAGPLKTTYRLV